MSQTDILQHIQSFASPWLDGLMIAISFIGDEDFYLATVPFLYLAVSKSVGIRVAAAVLMSSFANEALKYFFQTPRPIGADGIRSLYTDSAPGYSFPSGHSQGSATYWGLLATLVRRGWFYALAALLVLAVMLSRLYLGVHWPIDVVGGLVFGLFFVSLFHWCGGVLRKRPLPFGLLLLGSVLLPLGMLALYHEGPGRMFAGFLLGAWTGHLLEERHVGLQIPKTWWQRLIPVLLGLGSVFLWRSGLQMALPGDGVLQGVLRYAVIGFWATFALPWLLVKFGLYKGKSA